MARDYRGVGSGRRYPGEVHFHDTEQDVPPVEPRRQQAEQSEFVDPAPRPVSPWRVNRLGALLLVVALGASATAAWQWRALEHTRGLVADAGRATDRAVAARFVAESALAAALKGREAGPGRAGGSAAPDDPTQGEQAATPDPTADPVDPTASAATPPAADDRLLLLVTVGTRHFAEKQLRALSGKCDASLAVYRQRRGRCGWAQCFVVAAPAAQAQAARACGAGKGQQLRDRHDFAPL